VGVNHAELPGGCFEKKVACQCAGFFLAALVCGYVHIARVMSLLYHGIRDDHQGILYYPRFVG
jgi:hypothetical protein